MRFVTLKSVFGGDGGAEILVNLDNVSRIEPILGGGSAVVFYEYENFCDEVKVCETLTEITALIRKAQNS